jgi:hypothetical protein
MTKSNDKYWRTTDLYLGAYLFARGAAIAGIEARDSGVAFTFIESWDRQNWNDEFCFGCPLIDARIYVTALRTLQDKSDAVMERHGKD